MPAVLALAELLSASEQALREGRHAQGARLAQQAVQRARREEPAQLAASLSLLALHSLRIGHLDICLRAAQEAASALQGGARARLLSTMSMACRQAALLPQALDWAQQALFEARSVADAAAEGWALNRLGLALGDLGEYERAAEEMHRSLGLAIEIGESELEFAALNNLGSQSLERARKLGPASDSRRALLHEGLTHLHQARVLAVGSRNVHRQGISLLNLAELRRELGDLPGALSALATVEGLAVAHDLEPMLFSCRLERSLSLAGANQFECALTLLDDLQAGAPAQDDRTQLEYWRARVRVLSGLKRYEAALQDQEQVLKLALAQERARSVLHLQMLGHQHELEQLRAQAQRSRLEAEMQRLRAEQLRREAHEDALTGLYNRRFVDEQFPALRQRALRLGQPLLAAVVDADHFKAVNDRFGHRVGDLVLRELGSLIRAGTRVSDLAARLGGEEFLLLLPDTSPDLAREVCERLRQKVAATDWSRLAPELSLTVSIGVAVADVDDDPLGAADAALYRAKAAGRDQVCLG